MLFIEETGSPCLHGLSFFSPPMSSSLHREPGGFSITVTVLQNENPPCCGHTLILHCVTLKTTVTKACVSV